MSAAGLNIYGIPLWTDCPYPMPEGIEVRRVGSLVCLHCEEFNCGVDFDLAEEEPGDGAFAGALVALKREIRRRRLTK
jgi:hypothetical protein